MLENLNANSAKKRMPRILSFLRDSPTASFHLSACLADFNLSRPSGGRVVDLPLRFESRNPPRHALTVFLIRRAELIPQDRLFDDEDEDIEPEKKEQRIDD